MYHLRKLETNGDTSARSFEYFLFRVSSLPSKSNSQVFAFTNLNNCTISFTVELSLLADGLSKIYHLFPSSWVINLSLLFE